MKRIYAAAITAATLALSACGGTETATESRTATTTHSEPMPLTPESIEFRYTNMVDSAPDTDTISCKSKVVEADGVPYTLKGGTWSEKLDGSLDLSAAIAPESPNDSTVEVFVTFRGSTTVNIVEPPALAGTKANAYRKGEEMPYSLPVTMSLHTTGTEISMEAADDLGDPVRLMATLNGQSMGSCEY